MSYAYARLAAVEGVHHVTGLQLAEEKCRNACEIRGSEPLKILTCSSNRALYAAKPPQAAT